MRVMEYIWKNFPVRTIFNIKEFMDNPNNVFMYPSDEDAVEYEQFYIASVIDALQMLGYISCDSSVHYGWEARIRLTKEGVLLMIGRGKHIL